jgi:hypothetical protein
VARRAARSRGFFDSGRQSYRLLRAILNTAVTEDELIIVNPCRIKGAGEEQATERPVLTLDQLCALVDLMLDRWKAFLLLKTFASLRWGAGCVLPSG